MKRVLLVRPNQYSGNKFWHPVMRRPPYVLKYLHSLLEKEKFSQAYFIDAYADNLSFPALMQKSLVFLPDFAIICSSHLDLQTTLEYINGLKHSFPQLIVILVGTGPSSLPELYCQNKNIDFVFAGEAEEKTYEVIKNISLGGCVEEIKTIYKDNAKNGPILVEEPDKLPRMIYAKEDIKRYRSLYPLKISKRLYWGHILSSRGCPYPCIFCSPPLRDSYGTSVRLRNAINVADEIEYQIRQGVNIISFDDDNFTTSKEHVYGICKEIKKRSLDIRWIVHSRLDNLNKEIMKEMKEAGCCLLRMGTESGSERILKSLGKTDNYQWRKKAVTVFSEARSLKIETTGLFIIGSPGESEEEIKETIRFAKSLSPDIIQVAFFTPLPGSPYYKNHGFASKIGELDKMDHYLTVRDFNASSVTNERLKELYFYFYKSILLSPAFVFRHFSGKLGFYLLNPDIFFKIFNLRGIAAWDRY